ncbi:aspartic peptidase domain-containing protein [Cunninghamella echinulata]|nr:aspartic peptidase domain-containing protein [Cunninghamella echinulata]
MLEIPHTDRLVKIPLKFAYGVPIIEFAYGTPSQSFSGVFDTGSVVSWVMSDKCNSSVCTSVDDKTKFHKDQSSTNTAFDYTITVDYIDGSSVRVRPELDTLTLESEQHDIVRFPKHLLGEAYQVYLPKSYPSGTNGRLAVGDFGAFGKYLDSAQGLLQGLEHLAGVLGRAVADDRSTSTGYSAGDAPPSESFKKRDGVHSTFEWALGPDPSKYTGKLYKLPLQHRFSIKRQDSSSYWKLPIRSLRLTESPDYMSLTQKVLPFLEQIDFVMEEYGVVDSSTPYLHFPRYAAQKFNKAIGAYYNAEKDLYQVSCDILHEKNQKGLVIQFNGINVVIPPHQYIITHKAGCYSAVVNSKNDEIHLGGPFFRSFYLEFHTKEKFIGIAQSVTKLGYLYPNSIFGLPI